MINAFVFVCGVLIGVLFGVWIFVRASKDTEWAEFDLKDYRDFKSKQEWIRRVILNDLISSEDLKKYHDFFD